MSILYFKTRSAVIPCKLHLNSLNISFAMDPVSTNLSCGTQLAFFLNNKIHANLFTYRIMQNKWGWAKNERLGIVSFFNQNHFGPVTFKQRNHISQVSSETLSAANPTLNLCVLLLSTFLGVKFHTYFLYHCTRHTGC